MRHSARRSYLMSLHCAGFLHKVDPWHVRHGKKAEFALQDLKIGL